MERKKPDCKYCQDTKVFNYFAVQRDGEAPTVCEACGPNSEIKPTIRPGGNYEKNLRKANPDNYRLKEPNNNAKE